MEVFAKRNPDLNATDLAGNHPGRLTSHQAHTHNIILKDDVWFPGNRQDQSKPPYSNPVGQPDIAVGHSRCQTDLPLTENKSARENGGLSQSDGLANLHNGLSRRPVGENSFSGEQRIGSRGSALPWNRPAQWNTNNSSKSERPRLPVPCGQWGHVMFGTLFDPRRTFPGFGFMYSRQIRFRQPTYRYRKDPPTFGYLDPSAMMCEYLHNYRNFLRDLRVGMRRGKNYEQAIQWGLNAEFPHYLRPPVYSQNSSLLPPRYPQKSHQQHHHQHHQQPAPYQQHVQFLQQHQPVLHTQQQIPEVSPGLWSVLSEISTPQSRDLQIEFSRMMNTVTSTRMRKIWIDGRTSDDSGQSVRSPPGGDAEVTSSTEEGAAVPSVTSDQGGCGRKTLFASSPNALQGDQAGPDLSSASRCSQFSQADSTHPERGAATAQFGGEASPQHRRQATGSRRQYKSRYGLDEDRSLAHKTPHEDEDDISSLIDSARLELQIEEEEEGEEEVVQQQDPNGTENDTVSPCKAATEGSDSRANRSAKIQLIESELILKSFRRGVSESGTQLPETAADPLPEESERQVLFVLRKSTVNHHLSQDLQRDDATCMTSYPTVGPVATASLPIPCLAHSVPQDDDRRSFSGPRSAAASSPDCDRQHPDSLGPSSGLPSNCCSSRLDYKYSLLYSDEADFNGRSSSNNSGGGGGGDVSGSRDFAKHSPSKIRILGSKSYSEAYADSSDGPRKGEASAEDHVSGQSRTEGSGLKDSNRKPVVVSLRPLSHASRRGNHSYLTQRHSNRHRQCQNKQHSSRHRQQANTKMTHDARWDPGGPADRQTQLPDEVATPRSGSEAAGQPVTLCATQSAHETQNPRERVTDQDLLTQRRSASDSDVFCDSDQRRRSLPLIQTSGAGDTTLPVTPVGATAPSMSFHGSINQSYKTVSSVTTEGGRQCDREGCCCCACPDKQLHLQRTTELESRDAWLAPHRHAACDENQPAVSRNSTAAAAVCGMFYAGPGSGGLGEGVGWKLARRHSADDGKGSARKPSAASCDGSSRLCYASGQCHVAGQAAYSPVRGPSHNAQHEAGSAADSDLKSHRSTPLPAEGGASSVSKPPAHVLTQEQVKESAVPSPESTVPMTEAAFAVRGQTDSSPESTVPMTEAAFAVRGQTDSSPESTVPMTEAAFAEQIACSSVGFQPGSFRKYWPVDRDVSQSPTKMDRPPASVVLQSVQCPQYWPVDRDVSKSPTRTDRPPASVVLQSVQCPQEDGSQPAGKDQGAVCFCCRRDCSHGNGHPVSREAGNNPRSLLVSVPGGFRAGPDRRSAEGEGEGDGEEKRPADQQFPRDWIPLSSFTLQCRDVADVPSAESRLVQCYTINSATQAARSGKLSPTNLTTALATDIAATDQSHVSTGRDVPSGGHVCAGGAGRDVPSGGYVCAGGAGRGNGEQAELTATGGKATTTEGGGKSACKERILEEISAWFVDNSGVPAAVRKEDTEPDSRRHIPVRISQRNSVSQADSEQLAENIPVQDEGPQAKQSADMITPAQHGSELQGLLWPSCYAPGRDNTCTISSAAVAPFTPDDIAEPCSAKGQALRPSWGAAQNLLAQSLGQQLTVSENVMSQQTNAHNHKIVAHSGNQTVHSVFCDASNTDTHNSANQTVHSVFCDASNTDTHNSANQTVHSVFRDASNTDTHNSANQTVHSVFRDASNTDTHNSANQTVHSVFRDASNTDTHNSANQTVHSVFRDASNADRNGRLFSDVARAPTAQSANNSANLVSESGEDGSGLRHNDNSGGSFPVRTDHLCNQHLIPEQFRKLIVPDMERMMQLGRDRAWDKPPHHALRSQRGRDEAGSEAETGDGCESRGRGSRGAVSGSGQQAAKSSLGIRITAEELFASYEAAVIGSRNTQSAKATAFKTDAAKVEPKTSAGQGGCSQADSRGNVLKKAGVAATATPSPVTILPPSNSGADARTQNHVTKIPAQSGGTRGVEQKGHQQSLFAASPATSRPGPPQQHQPQPHQQQQQQQTLTFSTNSGKGRERVMTAAYYANTRLNDVMTYASINIPGLPRIPILSPQAAAQNAYMMKANSMRPCLQPNLSVPPPGFIPLLPVPTGHGFHHHGPGAYPMGPIFQPGVFHSPNFITMTPHPSGPTFMQQTKVNICANVNINSSVSATFNINTGNGHGNNSNSLPHNNLRATASATSAAVTTTTGKMAMATTVPRDCSGSGAGRKSITDDRLPGKASALGGWSPLAALKMASASASMPSPSASQTATSVLKSAAVSASCAGPAADGSIRTQGSQNRPATEQDDKASGRHKTSPKDARCKEDTGGRTEQERWRGAGGGASDGSSNSSVGRPRGSNTDNLIHVFPPRT